MSRGAVSPGPGKGELAAGIREAAEEVSALFSTLKEDDLAVQVHEEEGGWNAQQVLALLTANNARIHQFSAPEASHESVFGPAFEPWNRSWVAERVGRPCAQLLSEFSGNVSQLLLEIDSMTEQELHRVVPSRQGNQSLSVAIETVAIRHCRNHCERVRRSLGRRRV